MKKPLSLTLACLLSAAALLLPAALAQDETGTGRAPVTRAADEELGRAFRSYERLSLDTAAAAEQVRRTGRLRLNTGRRAFRLELEPHDLRAENYRAEQTVAPGVTLPLARGPARTYRGQALGIEGAREARFTIDEESFEGMILAKGERYYVEPARRYTPKASRTDFILYKASDVIETEPASCAAASLHERLGEAAGRVSQEPSVAAAVAGGGPTPQILASPLEAEIATEADFEFSTALGGAAAANSEIVSIMNQVEGIYQTEIGLSFKIVYQHVWTTSSDPYTTADPVLAIKEFTSEWNNDPHNVGFKTVVRDVAHMWTGKNLTNTAGVAWTGVVCKSPASAYGLSERIARTPQKIVLPAHEIGHTFNATHTDGTTGCANTIMQAVATDNSVLSFCTTSRNQITSFINTNSSCLSAAPACTFTISPTSASVPAAGGSGDISVTASDAGCAWTAASNATWLHVTAGASGNGSARVSYTADANTATAQRTGTITAAGKTFTVTQAGAIACTFSISPTSASFAAAGGSGSISVTASDANCNWTATTAASWIHITAGASGTGNGSVDFTVDSTTATASRTGTITAAGKTFTVTQAGAVVCTFTLATTSASLPAAGGTGTITVTGPAACNWTAVSNVTWIHITSGGSGSGNGTANFTVDANTATTSRTGTITIAGKTFTVTQAGAPPGLSSLVVNPPIVIGGCQSATGTVTLTAVAPSGGTVVTLSDNLAATTMPASVTVPAGAKTQTFTIAAAGVTTDQNGTVTAKVGAVSKTDTLKVRRVGVRSVKVVPNPIIGSDSATGTVTLECAAAPGAVTVTLSDTLAATTVPASVVVPAGATSRTFQLTTVAVSANQTGTLTASAGGVSKSVSLTVRRIGLASLTLSPNPVVGGQSSTGTVTLERVAGPGSITVTLTSSNTQVATVPSSVTIPAGTKSKTFAVTTGGVESTTTVTITATANGTTKTVTLTINPGGG